MGSACGTEAEACGESSAGGLGVDDVVSGAHVGLEEDFASSAEVVWWCGVVVKAWVGSSFVRSTRSTCARGCADVEAAQQSCSVRCIATHCVFDAPNLSLSSVAAP